MKVLHIGKYFAPYAGGMEHYLRDLMVAQAQQGMDTAALVHQAEPGLRTSHERWRADEAEFPVTRAAVWARVLFTPVSPTFAWPLRRLIRRQQPDILHLHMPNVSVFWLLLLPRARRIPWVVHWHADVPASRHSIGLRLFRRLYQPFEQAILQRCSAIISTSPPYLDTSQALGPYRSKCHVIPLGMDPGRLRPPSEAPTARNENAPLRVLAVGRLTYYKGFEYLIRAAAGCDNVEVRIVGTGELESHLRSTAQQLGLDSRVKFRGYLDDESLTGELAGCDCLCLPSIERTEAFGMVLLEAMYYGKATIACKVPGSGMGWVVDDGATGLHVPPENIPALADSLRTLQQDRGKVSVLGASGRRKFERLFHIDRSAASVNELYKLVLDGHPEKQTRDDS